MSPLQSRLVPIVHADDCGLSPGITETILACYDSGSLRRTSIVVNGAGWEHAVAALRSRPGLLLALHVNLFEGNPVSPPGDVDLLVDSQGRFSRSFAALLARGLASGRMPRLRGQIRLELRRQIDRFLDRLGGRGPLRVDGHVHYHVVPLVFEELVALSTEYPIDAIRLPREPLYWPQTRGAPRPPLMNVVKSLVLRALSNRARVALAACSVKCTEAFIGVLGTGEMTLAHVRAALDYLRGSGASGSVEILFHPGRCRPDEASLWNDRPELQAFYASANRDREAALLRSTALGDLLRAYGAVADDGPAATPVPEVSR
jgi:predicted glycoside hydrolase/deacetylase ChbG (UPF0249 family)